MVFRRGSVPSAHTALRCPGPCVKIYPMELEPSAPIAALPVAAGCRRNPGASIAGGFRRRCAFFGRSAGGQTLPHHGRIQAVRIFGQQGFERGPALFRIA